MNESHINRINELLGESVIYESKKKKTKIKLSLDDGTKKEMDFDGSLNDAKKKYSGKKVKTIRKSKSGDIIGEAVIIGVEELNESESSTVNKFPAMLASIKKALKNPTFSKGPIEFPFPKSEHFSKDVVKSFQKYFTDKGYKVEIGTDHPTTLYFDRTIASKLNESKELIPFGYFKITYSDGSSKKTEARAKTAEDFKKYLTQDGNDTVTDEDEDGKETKKKIVKVEKLDEATNSGKKLIKISYEIWDEDSIEAGETDDKGWKDEEGEEFESDEDGTASEKAIKFLKKKDATNASDGSYQSGTWYQDDGDTDMKTGDKKYLAYHLHGSWTPAEKKEIYSGVTNKKINESMDTEVHTFDTPMDMFRQIVKESQAIYIKEKNGKIEGRYNPKPKKDWILVDGFTAARAVQLYKAATEEQKVKIDKLSLTRFLNAIWKTKKVNESEETKESFKVNKALIVSESLPQYFETMLWSSTDMDSGEPLDKEYDVKDISKELKDSSKKDLLSFAEYCEKNCSKELEEYLEEEGYSSFGHDMWLSRNGHGAGFFDRGNGYKALQKASKTFGSVDPMVNKGKIVA